MKTGIWASSILLVMTAAFYGCGKSAPPAATPSAAQPPASTPAAPTAPPATSVAPSSATAPPVTPAASGSTPVPVDGDLPGVKVAVNELKRSSNALTLKFTVYNTSDKDFRTQGVFDGDSFGRFRHVGAIHLID